MAYIQFCLRAISSSQQHLIKKENNLLVGTFDIFIPQLKLNPGVKCIVLLSIILSEKTGMHAQRKSTINKILINNNNSSTIIILTNIV